MDRKRIILLLRSVIIATSAYVVLSGPIGTDWVGTEQWLFVGVFAASNLLLTAVPRQVFQRAALGPLLLLADTIFILFGLSWHQGLTQDLLLVYFFTLFLTTVGDSLISIALGSALVSGLYGYWLLMQGQLAIPPEQWLRLPFFFLIAVFYGSLTEQLKIERRRRQTAEQESQHLRVLLDLAGRFSEVHATREFVLGLGRFVEEACPDLRCHMVLRDAQSPVPEGASTFSLTAHGEQYGEMRVQCRDERIPSEREQWLCRMIAHAAAGSLYAAEQSDAAQSAADVKDQFLATISHELRTPLHAILGYSDVLDLSVPDADTVLHDSIQRLRVNACRLQDLIEQVLGFAEIRAGQRLIHAEQVDVHRLFEEMAPVTEELLVGKPVSFVWRVANDVGRIQTDRRKFKQILVCLVSNAAKFTDAGRIVLSAGVDRAGKIEIVVSDTGIGIPTSDLTAVFEDFRQVDGSLTRRHGGLGLGLSFARELVAVLAGTMDLDSRLGEGTTIRVALARRLNGAAAEPRPMTLESATPQVVQAVRA